MLHKFLHRNAGWSEQSVNIALRCLGYVSVGAVCLFFISNNMDIQGGGQTASLPNGVTQIQFDPDGFVPSWATGRNVDNQITVDTRTPEFGIVAFEYERANQIVENPPVGHQVNVTATNRLFYNLLIDGYQGLPPGSCLNRSERFDDDDPTKEICARTENDDLLRSWSKRQHGDGYQNVLFKNVTAMNAFRTINVDPDPPHTDTFQNYYGGSAPENPTAQWMVIQDSIFKNSDNNLMIVSGEPHRGIVYQNLSNGCDGWFRADASQRYINDLAHVGRELTWDIYHCTNALQASLAEEGDIWYIETIGASRPNANPRGGHVILVGASQNFQLNNEHVTGTVCRYETIEDALADTDTSDGCGNFVKPPFIELSCAGWGTPPAGCETLRGYNALAGLVSNAGVNIEDTENLRLSAEGASLPLQISDAESAHTLVVSIDSLPSGAEIVTAHLHVESLRSNQVAKARVNVENNYVIDVYDAHDYDDGAHTGTYALDPDWIVGDEIELRFEHVSGASSELQSAEIELVYRGGSEQDDLDAGTEVAEEDQSGGRGSSGGSSTRIEDRDQIKRTTQDRNADGVLDSGQCGVRDVVNRVRPGSKKPALLVERVDACFTRLEHKKESELGNADPSYDYPAGLFDFELTTSPGGTEVVTVTLDQEYDTENWTWRKYNAAEETYIDVPGVTFGTVEVDDEIVTTATFSIVDNGPLDLNPALGTIVDPSGPGIPQVSQEQTDDEEVVEDVEVVNQDAIEDADVVNQENTQDATEDEAQPVNEIERTPVEVTTGIPAGFSFDSNISLLQPEFNDPEDVRQLQQFLNDFEGESLAITGTYDNTSNEAVKRFQRKYRREILDVWNVTEATGFVGMTTRLKMNSFLRGQTTECPAFVEFNGGLDGVYVSDEIRRTKEVLRELGMYAGADDRLWTPETHTALVTFQETFREVMLDPWNIQEGTGYKYKTTNKFLNYLVGCTTNEVYLEGVGMYEGL